MSTLERSSIKINGLKFLLLALYAFTGLGIEALYAFLLEPLIYNVQMPDWTTAQDVIHWLITCATWGIIAYLLIRVAKKRYGFQVFERSSNVKAWQWAAVAVLVVLSLVESYLSWNGFKVIKEFNYNGLVKFIFQYIYYIFETGLFILIIVFGQKAFEMWFHTKRIPFGGILVALTWGLVHMITKDVLTGIISAAIGFVFGIVYLLLNRDIRKTYLIVLIMFIL